MLNKLVASVLTVSMVLALTGCSKKTEAANTSKATKTLVVGTSADYPPYEFHKKINGEDKIVGFDIMIAEEIAKDMGAKLEIKDMKFDGLLAALQAKNVDLILAGMNPTAERAKEVDFSKVYYTAVQAVIVRAEDKDKFKSLEDLNGKKVGAQKASTQEEIATKQIKGAEIKALGKVTDLVLSLKNKSVDAIVVEGPVAQNYADKNKDIVVSGMKFSEETSQKGSAAAIFKGNKELLDSVNKTLERLMKDDKISKFVADANDMAE